MARILLLLVVLTVTAAQASHKHHPKFPKAFEDYENTHLKRVACSSEHDTMRQIFIEESKCGAPKEVFEYLEPQGAHIQISPLAVWVKRCVGLCDYDTDGSKCVATRKQIRHIPVRINNVRTGKESCSTYAIEEHLSCGCCAGAPEDCLAPREYDPRKCACRCPNRKEKRNCRSKLNHRWNPSKCACEEKKRMKIRLQ